MLSAEAVRSHVDAIAARRLHDRPGRDRARRCSTSSTADLERLESSSRSCRRRNAFEGAADAAGLQPPRARAGVAAGPGPRPRAPDRRGRARRRLPRSRRCRSIRIQPGRDRAADPRRRPAACRSRSRTSPTVCNSMWALTDFTDANGATRLVPGTHLADHSPDFGQPLRLDPGRDATRQRARLARQPLARRRRERHRRRPHRDRDELLRRVGPPAGEPAAGHPASTSPARSRRACASSSGYSVYNMLIGHINKHSPVEILDAAPGSARMVWDV